MAKLRQMDHEAGGAVHDEWVKLKYGERGRCTAAERRNGECR
jgi:hypothetical protein